MSKKKILLIEDTITTIDFITEVLSGANYDVFISTNGELAIDKAEINLPDLILLDILMPNIDGFEICKKLKSNNNTKDIPVVFISALTEAFDKVKAFQLGAADYITKPVNNEELLARVNTHIELSKARKKIEESERVLKDIIKNQGEGFGITDSEENFTFVNPAAEKIFGVPENTLVGRNLQEFIDTKQFRKIKQQTEIRKTGKISTYEITITRPDKQNRQLLITATPDYDKNKNFQGAIGVFRDITMRKETEDALKNLNITLEQRIEERTKQLSESEQKFRDLFNENPVSLWEEDISELIKLLDAKKKDGITDFIKYFDNNPGFVFECASKIKVLNINQASLDIHKAPSEEYLMKNLIKTFNERSVETFKRVLIAIAERKSSFQEETEYLNLKGEVFFAIIQYSIIENSEKLLVSITDISQLKETEHALKESEERLLEAQKIAHTGHWEWDIKSGKLLWSAEVYKIFGVIPETFKVSVESFEKAMHPDDLEFFINERELALNNKDLVDIEHRIIRPNGEIRHVIERSVIGRDSSGSAIFVRGTIQDITDYKLAEQKLIESKNKIEANEIRFRRILNTFFHGVYICSPDYYVEYLNLGLEKRVGENSLGEKCYKAIYNLNEKCKWCVFDELTTKNHVTYKLKNPVDNKYYQVKNMLLDNGSKLTMFEDISKQEKAEKEILKLITAVEQSANMVIITNPEGIIEYVNKKFSEVTGCTKEEVIGKTPAILISGKQSKKFFQNKKKIIKSGGEWKGELQNKKKNGELFWVSAIISPILDINGEIVNFIGILEDITERKLHERRMFNAIIETEETERKRFAEDLHDELGPYLSGIKLYVTQFTKEKLTLKERLQLVQNLDEMIDESISITKLISNSLMPNILTNFGYISALESFINKINSTQNLHIDFIKPKVIKKINPTHEIVIYRIIIELINNTLKHAYAEKIEISIVHNRNIKIVYTDNGIGFNLQNIMDEKKGNGLINIFNRLKSINAQYTFNSNPDIGIHFAFEISN
ncbi:MAG: PAS domain S-box protein [Bacteroidales bacterium]|nr:PAS domain S-box protein [Bacteroidales bacterium]